MDEALRQAATRLLAAVRVCLEREGAPDEIALGFSPARPEVVDGLVADYALPPVYAEFLRHFASDDFIDTGLRFGGVACWISTAQNFENLHLAYAGQDDWPDDWIVIAGEYEGCY